MATKLDKQARSRERRLLQSESRWLQKALFALSKAETDRGKLAELRGADPEPLSISLGKKSYEMDAVQEAVQDAVDERLEEIRATLKKRWNLVRR